MEKENMKIGQENMNEVMEGKGIFGKSGIMKRTPDKMRSSSEGDPRSDPVGKRKEVSPLDDKEQKRRQKEKGKGKVEIEKEEVGRWRV